MLRRAIWLALFSSTAWAATPYVPLAFNYTEWGPFFNDFPTTPVRQIAADRLGELYILSQCSRADAPFCLIKVSADGKNIVWQKTFPSVSPEMAVDPNGNVYLNEYTAATQSYAIEKLSSADGGVLWRTPTQGADIAVDDSGRVFTGGVDCSSSPCTRSVIRLNTAGAIETAFPNVPIVADNIAVDPTGSYIAVSFSLFEPEAPPDYTFAVLGPDSNGWVKFNAPLPTVAPAIAVAANGDVVIHGRDASGNRSLQRIDRNGAVVFSRRIPSWPSTTSVNGAAFAEMALDTAGNAYLTGYTGALGTPARNSLATCGTTWLGVYAPDGSMLQTTYLPGATSSQFVYGLIAVGAGGAVFVLDTADTTFTPTQIGPFAQFQYGPMTGSTQPTGSSAVYKLSPNTNAPIVPLACVVNAASFGYGAVAPGELVALYGTGLGPEQGVSTTATLEKPFPTDAAGTKVTFDGKPAPLLWVQDGQVNAAVPWSVAGPTTQICVTRNNQQASCLTWPVTPLAAGVFTVDGTHAAALNQDGTINSASNPAAPDSIVSVWATGLGPITPALPDGSLVGLPLPVSVAPPLVGQPCGGNPRAGFPGFFCASPMTYAGPAPFLIAGTVQINFHASVNGVATNSFMVLGGNAFLIYVAGQ